MDISNISDLYVNPDWQMNSKIASVEKVLNKMYFDVMFKQAFTSQQRNNSDLNPCELYSELYMNSLADDLSKNHSFGFGQLIINTNKSR